MDTARGTLYSVPRIELQVEPAHAGTVLHRPLSMEWSEIPKYLQHQGSVFHFGFIVGQFIHQMVSRSLLCALSEEICSLLPGVADQLA